MKHPFNVGDIVRCVDEGNTSLVRGSLYTVSRVYKTSGGWYVNLEEIEIEHNYRVNRFVFSHCSLEND